MAREETEPNVYNIPKNAFDTGYVFGGLFRTRNFVEGIIVALPFLGIFAYGWTKLGWDILSTVAYCVILCAGAFMATVIGVDGDSLFEFIARVIRFRKNRRISKYNPRIKTELEPDYLIHDDKLLPREKLKRAYESIKGKVVGGEENAISADINSDNLHIYYDDDENFIEKPEELKTQAELKAEAKQRAKEEKEYIKSLPRSEHKAAKAALKQKHKEEDEAKKQREAEQEAMIQAAVQRRLDKAERVKQAQARAKLEEENAAKENENISSESIVQQTTDESTSDVQSVDTLQHSEIETVRAEEKAPAIDTTVQDDSEEIEVELLDIEDKPVEQKQPVKSAVSPISQYVGLDEEIEVDIDDLDEIPLTPTERYQVTHLGARKITRKGKARPKLNTNTSLNDISIFDSAR